MFLSDEIWLFVENTDTGVGLSEEGLPRIIERPHWAEGSRPLTAAIRAWAGNR